MQYEASPHGIFRPSANLFCMLSRIFGASYGAPSFANPAALRLAGFASQGCALFFKASVDCAGRLLSLSVAN